MRVLYEGPSAFVNVAPYGRHGRGETKDYPDALAAELLATSKRQRFAAVAAPAPSDPPDPSGKTLKTPKKKK